MSVSVLVRHAEILALVLATVAVAVISIAVLMLTSSCLRVSALRLLGVVVTQAHSEWLQQQCDGVSRVSFGVHTRFVYF